jgi:hypothetical protein
MDHSIVIAGTKHPVPAGTAELPPGRGLCFPNYVSNLSTTASRGLKAVASSWSADTQTTVSYYAPNLPSAERSETVLYTRVVKNLLGETVLDYRVRAEMFRFGENKYLVSLYPAGGGHAGFTVTGKVLFADDSRVIVKVDESIFGDLKSFQIELLMAANELTSTLSET